MITFSIRELLSSALFAVIFGVGFSAFVCTLDILIGAASTLPEFLIASVRFDKVFPPARLSVSARNRGGGPIYIFLCILIFALGFSLLSYISLDGEIRIYMLILAFASFYLSKIAFCDFLTKAFLWLFNSVLSLTSVALRCAILPIKLIIKFVKKAQINAQIF